MEAEPMEPANLESSPVAGRDPLHVRLRHSPFSGSTMTNSNMEDPFQLERFVKAQEGIYDTALSELRTGRKRSHWMWFIFPQIDGLARSSTAGYFAIKSVDEAKAYLEHPVLGPRLLDLTFDLILSARLSADPFPLQCSAVRTARLPPDSLAAVWTEYWSYDA